MTHDLLVYSLAELPTITGLSRGTLSSVINSGQLKAKKAGRRTLVLREDLDAYLRALPPASPTSKEV